MGEEPKMPPWVSWDPKSLPLCKHWRNAHEVPYPMIGANCVNERESEPLPKNALVQEPWDEKSLGTCNDRKPAHVVAYPFVGANCRIESYSPVSDDEALKKNEALVQKGEPWNKDSLGSCSDRKPAHVVPFPMVGANCDPDKPQKEKIIPALA